MHCFAQDVDLQPSDTESDDSWSDQLTKPLKLAPAKSTGALSERAAWTA